MKSQRSTKTAVDADMEKLWSELNDTGKILVADWTKSVAIHFHSKDKKTIANKNGLRVLSSTKICEGKEKSNE